MVPWGVTEKVIFFSTLFEKTLPPIQKLWMVYFKIPGSPSGRYSSDFGSPKINLTSPNILFIYFIFLI